MSSKKINSRISGFYKKSITERLKFLLDENILSEQDYQLFMSGSQLLKSSDADKMIENVIGVFGLPFALGFNFMINGKDYIIPMVVEEPSVVAAVSAAAKVIRDGGGFISETMETLLVGQIQLVGIEDMEKAKQAVLDKKAEIMRIADDVHPEIVQFGGGARDLEVRVIQAEDQEMMIVQLLVDTVDAMGANLVNTMCEAIAETLEELSGGKAFLKILSNLADRSLVKVKCRIPLESLAGKGFSGEQVRDGVILAYKFAAADPYRAATHNKGIMNGIDPVVIATGNDWRAVEAAAHAYAAKDGKYTSLTKWYADENGDLTGEIELPIRVGIVGGSLQSNPSAPIARRILNIESSRELMDVLGAVGLAQNFAAIRALATEGIQRGHMSLHARSVVQAAGAPNEIFEQVVQELIKSKDIKIPRAKEIIEKITSKKQSVESTSYTDGLSSSFGKIILFGEHAVVYGSHAIAAPIPNAMQARISKPVHKGLNLFIPEWQIDEQIEMQGESHPSIHNALVMILNELDLNKEDMKIEVYPHIPTAVGLGGSASMAVAIIRALDKFFNKNLSDEQVNELAFKSETIFHGTASGIDNTLATYGKFMLFKKGSPPFMKNLVVKNPIRFVIGLTGVEGLTVQTVGRVRELWQSNKSRYQHIFDDIDHIVMQAVEAIEKNDLAELGNLMDINQGLLNALQVSGPEIEQLVHIARAHGALGSKLTGGGGGGAVIALCPAAEDKVMQAMHEAGFKSFTTVIE
ncbi:MAG: hydroxymethylglutaryl-CoA reductase, degradative [Calditrichaceae bacterium]|nr:hydroxymethylglutaryl-CoA reductase, degradative [Calditrichaceae bacterium]